MRWAIAALVFAAGHAAAAEDTGATTVPFEMSFNIVHVNGSLNGQPGHLFIVDTGANVSLVTPEAADKVGWEVGRGRTAYAESLGAGDLVVRNVRVYIGDAPGGHFLRTRGLDYSGILGLSFFERFVTTFDYHRHELTFVPAAKAPPLAADGKESWLVPFRTAARIIVVEGSINGQGPFTFIVDSGSTNTIVMPETARKLGIKGKRKWLGRDEVEVAMVESISAGDATARDFGIVIDDSRIFRPLRQFVNYSGVLGASYLQRFVVTFDYRVNRLRLATAAR